jgi:hypothetical protein
MRYRPRVDLKRFQGPLQNVRSHRQRFRRENVATTRSTIYPGICLFARPFRVLKDDSNHLHHPKVGFWPFGIHFIQRDFFKTYHFQN